MAFADFTACFAEAFLHFAAGFLGLAFRAQILVVGKVTGRLLRLALYFLSLTLHFVLIPH